MGPTAEDILESALELVAPGTALREAIDSIQAARSGALLVLGDEKAVAKISDGGFRLDTPFEAERMFELSKMDGAIILDEGCKTIIAANVHLVPDAGLETSETGIRHRTAERVSRQTGALVIAVSKRRVTVSIYRDGQKLVLEHLESVLTKATQALQTLQRYRSGFDEASAHLTALEFDDGVTLDSVVTVIQRAVAARRVDTEVARYIQELGSEGRLVRMQSDELMHSLEDEYTNLLRDYSSETGPRKVLAVRTKISELSQEHLLDGSAIAQVLGYSASANVLESHVRPRGYRVLNRIPLLPNAVVNRLVDRFEDLRAVRDADVAALDDVDGVGERRARAIMDGLRRMQEHGGQ